MAEPPLLLVPSILWRGGSDSLYKVPFHTFGSTKQRHLRLKQHNDDLDGGIDVAIERGSSSQQQHEILRASSPLALIWDDPHNTATPTKNVSTFLPSPFNKRVRGENELLLREVEEVIQGSSSAAFQAFIAKNGRSSIPDSSCCFSIVGSNRSLDFYVSSSGGVSLDSAMANAWVSSIKTLLQSFHQVQNEPVGSHHSAVKAIKHIDSTSRSEELFQAATSGDLSKLRWHLDRGCPIDLMEESTGDTVLIVACRLGLYEVARLALHQYNARNDPHPNFGQTGLQVAVSSGHVNIVKLILKAAESSGADRVISNHEDENGEAPIHIAARCGSVEILELLLMHGANVGLVDSRTRTCLHCAAHAGQAECLRVALFYGSDEFLEVMNDNGYTCLHLAIRSNNTKCVEILLQAGADVTAETADGSNAYELATKQRCQGIMKLLLEYGISSVDQNSDSYGCDSDDGSSFSGDLFEGLNTYSVSPAPKHLLSSITNDRLDTPSTYFSAMDSMHRTPSYSGSTQKSGFDGGTAVNESPHYGYHQTPQPHNSHTPIVQHNEQGFSDDSSPGISHNGDINYEGLRFIHDGDMWTICFSEDERCMYFYNANNNISTWDDPRRSQIPYSSPEHTHQTRIALPPQTFSSGDGNDGNVVPPRTIGNASVSDATMTIASSISSKSIQMKYQSEHQAATTVGQPEAVTVAKRSQISMEAVGASSVSNDFDNVSPLAGTESNHSTSADMKSTITPSRPAPESKGDCKIVLSKEDAAIPQKYRMMLKMGVPADAVRHKASSDGIKPEIVNSFFDATFRSLKATPASADPRASLLAQITRPRKSSIEATSNKSVNLQSKEKVKEALMNGEATKKFMKMASIGVPPPAVVHKMKQERLDVAMINMFKEFHGLIPSSDTVNSASPPRLSAARNKTNVPSKDELISDSVLARYVRMAKVGVPLPGIESKMKQDGVEQEKIELFNAIFGLGSNTGSTSPKAYPMVPMHREGRRASKALQKIHWTTVKEDRLQNSLWASQTKGDDIDESDLKALEKLFSASPTKKSVVIGRKSSVQSDGKNQQSLIDPKRANNIVSYICC